MVMACLNRKIGEHEYKMLIDSGSELNIMTLNQAQELALPIDDSGNSWTLKGISGHMMGLEGICWNILVMIGGIEFLHNFFITRMFDTYQSSAHKSSKKCDACELALNS